MDGMSDWFWWAFALALFALEALMPGVFMLWLGFAALGVGVLHLLVPELPVTAQWIAFSLLSLVAVAIAWRVKRARPARGTDHPHLNRRAEQLVGRVLPLEQAIVDGRGRVKVGDAFWAVSGPDLPAGTRVRVDAVEQGVLRVRAQE